jgi:RNA polymerase sigma factor (sigma-70 family)
MTETLALHSTADLIALARSGDERAKTRLVERYWNPLRRWAHGRLPARARGLCDTDDLVQSALIQAFNHLDAFEPRREGALLAYLRKILLNRIRDEIRRSNSIPDHDGSTDSIPSRSPSPLENLIGKELLHRCENALETLTEQQREAFILRIELGFPYRTVAEALELSSPNAARMTVARALVRISESLRGDRGQS